LFTGIVEECGTIRTIARRPEGLELHVAAPLTSQDLRTGDSIAVDGVCLTAERVADGEVTVVAAAETLALTTLDRAAAGRRVHLERALRVGDRLGGHIVQGHVDGVGRIARRAEVGGSPLLDIEAPPAVARYLIVKGSIAVDGVSLTVNRVEDSRFEVLQDNSHVVELFHPGFCISTATTIRVEWDGTVMPCCRDQIVIGNLHERRFPEIWNGEPMQRLRETFFRRQLRPYCQRCMAFYNGHA